MAYSIQRIDYFTTTVRDEPGEAYKLLSTLSALGVNLSAFTAVPVGPGQTQLTIFPENDRQFETEAARAGMKLEGPFPALLVRGDDRLGALADVHMRLYEANVNVYAASGVSDGHSGFGYIIYVRPEEIDRAVAAFHG